MGTVRLQVKVVFDDLRLNVEDTEVFAMSTNSLAYRMTEDCVPPLVVIVAVPTRSTPLQSFFGNIQTLTEVVQRVVVGMDVHLRQAVLILNVLQLLLTLDDVDIELAEIDPQLIDGILVGNRLLLQLVDPPLQPLDGLTKRPVLVRQTTNGFLGTFSPLTLIANVTRQLGDLLDEFVETAVVVILVDDRGVSTDVTMLGDNLCGTRPDSVPFRKA